MQSMRLQRKRKTKGKGMGLGNENERHLPHIPHDTHCVRRVARLCLVARPEIAKVMIRCIAETVLSDLEVKALAISGLVFGQDPYFRNT